MTTDDWAARVAAVWDESDEIGDNILRERIDALDLGLREPNCGRTFIQYASTLRNLRRYDEGLAPISAFAPHLPRYQRSMANYARELLEGAE